MEMEWRKDGEWRMEKCKPPRPHRPGRSSAVICLAAGSFTRTQRHTAASNGETYFFILRTTPPAITRTPMTVPTN